jgi:hypothetical protein
LQREWGDATTVPPGYLLRTDQREEFKNDRFHKSVAHVGYLPVEIIVSADCFAIQAALMTS